MGVFTGLNVFYVSSSRLLFAMGRAMVLPKAFGKVHPKYKTPYIGILFTMAVTVCAPFFGREALLWGVCMSALGVTIAYFYPCFVAYRLFKWSEYSAESDRGAFSVAPCRKCVSICGPSTTVVY